MLRGATAAVGCVVVMTACAAEPDGGGPLPPSLVTGPYADTLDAFCGFLDRCPSASGVPLAYRSRRECKQVVDFAIGCELTTTDVGDSTRFGLMRRPLEVTRELADACSAWLESATCDSFGDGGATNPCAAVFAFDDDDSGGGGQPQPPAIGGLDAACETDEQCEESLYCTSGGIDRDEGVIRCRVCRPRLEEGGECSTLRSCVDGLVCKLDEEAGAAFCIAPGPVGTDCTSEAQCASGHCNFDLDPLTGRGVCDDLGRAGDSCELSCRGGLFCDDGTCRAQAGAGESCTAAVGCVSLFCQEGRCVLPFGAACESDSDCMTGSCGGGLCGAMPSNDGSCFDEWGCPDGQVCNLSQGRCQAPQPNGSGCDGDEQCTSGWCSDESDRCADRPGIGDPCSSFSNACGGDAYCGGSGTCRLRAGPDEACEGPQGCKLPFLCQEGRCRLPDLSCRPASAGEPCALMLVCDDQSWCDLVGGSVCRPRYAVGAECDPPLIPGTPVCAMGSRCEADSSGVSRCRALAQEGDACAAADDCVTETFCVNSVCTAGFGQACNETEDCPEDAFCSWPGDVCVPLGAAGAECRDDEECVEGFHCSWPDSECAPPGGVGAECQDDEECESDLICTVGACVERGQAGASCNDDRECAPSTHCGNERMCVEDLAAGAACTSSRQCDSSTFCDNDEQACRTRLPDTAECSLDEECQSGACVGRVCVASRMCVPPP